MTVELYGKMPDGTDVHRITLKGGGLSANVLTYGGVIQDLRLDGHAPARVLGFEHFSYQGFSVASQSALSEAEHIGQSLS